MSLIKSFSVGNGDAFYIKHNSDNFSIIDCNLKEERKKEIVDEIIEESQNKGIFRFISTHPDEDHIHGLEYLDSRKEIVNFYTVKNEAIKEDKTTAFLKYCELRDSSKAYYIEKGCHRRWMNDSDETRGSSGISILWPYVDNECYIEALQVAKDGGSPNNISPIIKYSLENGAKIMWMGDLETEFMENIEGELNLSKVNILFAPHHGRDSGKVPKSMLDILEPDIIIIGEAPSGNINYYEGYNTITQNSAEDITFDCENKIIHIYTSNNNYSVDFLTNKNKSRFNYYLGSLEL